jgi:hypothetical protein
MNDFVSVAMRLAGSVFRAQSYGSVVDLIDILSGLAGLTFLAIVLLVHEDPTFQRLSLAVVSPLIPMPSPAGGHNPMKYVSTSISSDHN